LGGRVLVGFDNSCRIEEPGRLEQFLDEV